MSANVTPGFAQARRAYELGRLRSSTWRALPVAFAVAVRELTATRKLLEGNGVPLAVTPAGDLFVPATAAAGAAVIFRQSR